MAFSECNQTHENIFQNNFHNATKHLKIFSFLENNLHLKIFYIQPNAAYIILNVGWRLEVYALLFGM